MLGRLRPTHPGGGGAALTVVAVTAPRALEAEHLRLAVGFGGPLGATVAA